MLETQQILKNAYEKLGVCFVENHVAHLHIKQFDISHFSDMTNVTDTSYAVVKGINMYYFHNIYEILLWYYFYTIKYKHIKHHNSENKAYSNKAYFSRIPCRYKQLKPSVGLSIIKKLLDRIILKNKGVPKYYDHSVLSNILTIK